MHCSVFNFCHVNLLLFERDEMGVSHAFRVHNGRNFKVLSKNYVAFLILEIAYASRNNFTVGIGKKQYLNEDFVYSIIIDVESKNASLFLDNFYGFDHSGVSTTLNCTVRISNCHPSLKLLLETKKFHAAVAQPVKVNQCELKSALTDINRHFLTQYLHWTDFWWIPHKSVHSKVSLSS